MRQIDTPTDCISRQAAIDALAKNMPSLTTPDGCGEFDHDIQVTDEAYVDCMQIIHELPSAQPEQRWIPCGERLPEEYTRVIGYMAWHAMTVIEYQHGRWYSIDHLEPLPDEAVSHWMPLPKPPKEGTK